MQYDASGVTYADDVTKSITSVLDMVENDQTDDKTLRASSASSSVTEGRVVKHRDAIINQHALCLRRRRIFSEIAPNLLEQNAQVRSINSHLNNQISHKYRLSSDYDENLTPSELLNQFGGNRNKENYDEGPTSVTGSVNGLNGYLKMNQGPTRRVRSVTSPPHPIPLGRQANAMEGASYQRFPQVKIREVNKDDYLKFELRETDASMENGLQRMMISEVPPTVDVTNNKDIYSSDHSVVPVDISDSASYDSSEQKGIITVELHNGRELMLSAIARKGVGKDHENWCPAATATFMYEGNIYFNIMETLTYEEKKALVDSSPIKVFDIDDNSQQFGGNRNKEKYDEGPTSVTVPKSVSVKLNGYLEMEQDPTPTRRVRSVTSPGHPIPLGRQANIRAMEQRFPRVKIIERKDDYLKFELGETDVSMANGLQRMMISEVPTLDSNNDMYSSDRSVVPVDFSNSADYDSSEQKGIITVELRKGRELMRSAIARKGIEKYHENWSPAATVTFMYEPEIHINEDMIEILTYEEKKKVFAIDDNSQQKEDTASGKKAHTVRGQNSFTTTITDLPREILSRIFSNLPIRDIGRCYCVSKDWSQMTPLMKDYTGKTSIMVRYCSQKESFRQYQYSTPYPNVERTLSFPNFIKSPIRMIGISNGLICFISDNDVVFWNPSLFKLFSFHSDVENSAQFGFGFGYDITNKDFKVIRILYEKNDKRSGFSFAIFSLKSNRWHAHPFFSFETISTIRWKQSTWGSIIHWLMGLSTNICSILTFSLTTNTFGNLCLPEPLNTCPLNSLSLTCVNGSTAAVAYFNVAAIDIWYFLNNSWTRINHIVPRIEGSLNGITDVLWVGNRKLLIEMDGRDICPYYMRQVFSNLLDMAREGTPYVESFSESFALDRYPTSYVPVVPQH